MLCLFHWVFISMLLLLQMRFFSGEDSVIRRRDEDKNRKTSLIDEDQWRRNKETHIKRNQRSIQVSEFRLMSFVTLTIFQSCVLIHFRKIDIFGGDRRLKCEFLHVQ